MKIALGSDHAGYASKEMLKRRLLEKGHEVDDCGAHGSGSVDYPDYAAQVGRRVAKGGAQLGVLVCGSGIGMSIAANKVRGVRAARCTDPWSARLAREHNDANVLCVGERVTGPGLLVEILDAFLAASFEGGRHAARVDKIQRLESMTEGDPGCGC